MRRYLDKLDWMGPLVAGRQLLYIGNVDDLPYNTEKHVALHEALAARAASTFAVYRSAEAAQKLRTRGYEAAVGGVGSLGNDRLHEIVVVADALEHLSNCGQFLVQLAGLVTPDGILLVTTPNPTGLARVLETVFLGAPRANRAHTCWFTGSVLDQLAMRCGWRVKQAVDIDDLRFYHDADRYRMQRGALGLVMRAGLLGFNAAVCGLLPQFCESRGFLLRREAAAVGHPGEPGW
jgi:hypothetical protein